jgi:hypothetical protein
MIIEGSGAGSGFGSIPLTNGSGSGSRRPKNIRFRRSGFGSGSATLHRVITLFYYQFIEFTAEFFDTDIQNFETTTNTDNTKIEREQSDKHK